MIGNLKIRATKGDLSMDTVMYDKCTTAYNKWLEMLRLGRQKVILARIQ